MRIVLANNKLILWHTAYANLTVSASLFDTIIICDQNTFMDTDVRAHAHTHSYVWTYMQDAQLIRKYPFTHVTPIIFRVLRA